MLPEYTRKSNAYVAIGLCLHLAYVALKLAKQPAFLELAVILGLAGIPFFVYGCGMYLQAKGHTRFWSFLGMFGLPGLIILRYFPDRHRNADVVQLNSRRQVRGFLWGGAIGLALIALPGILGILFSEQTSGSKPVPWYAAALGVVLFGLLIFMIGGLLGIMVQSLVRLVRGGETVTVTACSQGAA